jgi:phospholipase/carboxylesterase
MDRPPSKPLNDHPIVDTVQIGDWVLRMRIPSGEEPFPVILMLHGWTGDENAMWIFATRFPSQAMLIAPRGLYSTPLGGFGWHVYKAKIWPWVDDFRPAIEALKSLLTTDNFPRADFSRLHLAGFSQGAALAYTFLMQDGGEVRAVAGLSGFLPDGAETLLTERALTGKPIFIAHGSEDDLVPVDRARKAVAFFQDAGAQVIYCEEEVGHKLSANCFRGLESFFAKQI